VAAEATASVAVAATASVAVAATASAVVAAIAPADTEGSAVSARRYRKLTGLCVTCRGLPGRSSLATPLEKLERAHGSRSSSVTKLCGALPRHFGRIMPVADFLLPVAKAAR
jgi:hypothetical protein